MNRIAKFEKVSFEQFRKDFTDIVKDDAFGDNEIEYIYNGIKLPHRGTSGSAGYDFHMPFSTMLHPNKIITVPTGIRCKIDDGWVMQIYPRSGIGFNTGMRLANTCGIIDSDYYYSGNEGHIIIRMVVPSRVFGSGVQALYHGDRFCQGVLIPYGITVDDDVSAKRDGGIGSTGE